MAGTKQAKTSSTPRQSFAYRGVHCLDSFIVRPSPKLFGYLRCGTSVIWRDLTNPKSKSPTHAKAGQLIVDWHSRIEEKKKRESTLSKTAPTLEELFDALRDDTVIARLKASSTHKPVGWYLYDDQPATWWWVLTGYLIIRAAPEHFDYGCPPSQCTTRAEIKRCEISLEDWHRVFLHMRAFRSEFRHFSSLETFLDERRRSIGSEQPEFPQATKLNPLAIQSPVTTSTSAGTSSSSTQPAAKKPNPVNAPSPVCKGTTSTASILRPQSPSLSSQLPKAKESTHNVNTSSLKDSHLQSISTPGSQIKAEPMTPDGIASPGKKPQPQSPSKPILQPLNVKRAAPENDSCPPLEPAVDASSQPSREIYTPAHTIKELVSEHAPAAEPTMPKDALTVKSAVSKDTSTNVAKPEVLDPIRRELVPRFKNSVRKMPLQKRKDMAKDPKLPWYLLEHLKKAIEEGEKEDEEEFSAEKDFLNAWGVDVDGDIDMQEEA